MIFRETFVRAIDNSGANYLKCIRLFNGVKWASVGHLVLGVIKFLKKKRKIKKHLKLKTESLKKKNKVLCIVIGTKAPCRRNDGSSLTKSRNGVVVVSKQLNFLGTRIYGVLPRELRRPLLFKKFKALHGFLRRII